MPERVPVTSPHIQPDFEDVAPHAHQLWNIVRVRNSQGPLGEVHVTPLEGEPRRLRMAPRYRCFARWFPCSTGRAPSIMVGPLPPSSRDEEASGNEGYQVRPCSDVRGRACTTSSGLAPPGRGPLEPRLTPHL